MDDIRALPYRRVRVENEYDRRIWGEGVHLAECHYSGKEPEEGTGRRSLPPGKGLCSYCNFVTDLGDDGKLVRHARMLQLREQAERQVEQLCSVLGFDPWGDVATHARAAASDSREDSLDLRVAAGMHHLQTALVKRGAAQEAAVALRALTRMKVGDEMERDITDSRHYEEGDEEAPFFTEAFLYNLLGKDAARTVLARFGKLEAALGGAAPEEDED